MPPPDIGQDILRASQVLVQQFAQKQQLDLQTLNLEAQVRAQQKNFQLKADELKLRQEMFDLQKEREQRLANPELVTADIEMKRALTQLYMAQAGQALAKEEGKQAGLEISVPQRTGIFEDVQRQINTDVYAQSLTSKIKDVKEGALAAQISDPRSQDSLTQALSFLNTFQTTKDARSGLNRILTSGSTESDALLLAQALNLGQNVSEEQQRQTATDLKKAVETHQSVLFDFLNDTEVKTDVTMRSIGQSRDIAISQLGPIRGEAVASMFPDSMGFHKDAITTINTFLGSQGSVELVKVAENARNALNTGTGNMGAIAQNFKAGFGGLIGTDIEFTKSILTVVTNGVPVSVKKVFLDEVLRDVPIARAQ
jgi:hypothetical protein